MFPILNPWRIVPALFALLFGCKDLDKSEFLDADMENGEVSWVVQVNGPGWEQVNGVGVLAGGDIVTTGYVESGQVDFCLGGGNPESSVDIMEDRVAHVARYASSGSLTWVKTIEGNSSAYGNDVVVAPDGSAIVGGKFWSSAVFGAEEANQIELIGWSDTGYIAKYGVDGLLTWARGVVPGEGGADGNQQVSAVDATSIAGGDRYVTVGDFTGEAIFGFEEPLETTLITDPGERSLFVAAYEEGGDLAWAKQTTGETFGADVSFLPDGTIAVVGYFSGKAVFDPGESSETTLQSSGSKDGFVARYADDGELIYARAIGGVQSDETVVVAALLDGSILAAGGFEGSLTLGAGEATETTLTSAGKKDVFFASYKTLDGTLNWARRLGGGDVDEVWDVTAIENGGFLLVGGFKETAHLGLFGEVEINLTSRGNFDIYLAKYDAHGDLLSARSEGGPGLDSGRAVSAPSNSSAVVAGIFESNATFGEGEPGETQLQADAVDAFVMRVEY